MSDSLGGIGAKVPLPGLANLQADAAGTGSPQSGTTPAPQSAEPAKKPYVNPQFQVDPHHGVVILEYRDATGKVVRQVPSEYQLKSYQPPGEKSDKGPAATG